MDGPNREEKIQSAWWVSYPQGGTLLTQMSAMAEKGRSCGFNLVVTGEPGSGKSALMLEFARRSQSCCRDDPERGCQFPVLALRAPAHDSSLWLSRALSERLVLTHQLDRWDRKISKELSGLLRRLGTRLLVFDDLHFVAYHSQNSRKRFFDILGELSENAGFAFVAFCEPDDAELLEGASGSVPLEYAALTSWTMGPDYLRFIAEIDRCLGSCNGMGLQDEGIAGEILSRSDGVTGRIVSLAREAAVAAIRGGHTRINRDILAAVTFC